MKEEKLLGSLSIQIETRFPWEWFIIPLGIIVFVLLPVILPAIVIFQIFTEKKPYGKRRKQHSEAKSNS